jgi:hypothetical protein
MAAALLRVLRGMWRQSFGSDFVFWAAGARPKVLRGRHFAVLAVLKKKNSKTKTPRTPLFRLYFFAPLCSLPPLGVSFLAGGPSEVEGGRAAGRQPIMHEKPEQTPLEAPRVAHSSTTQPTIHTACRSPLQWNIHPPLEGRVGGQRKVNARLSALS